MKYELTELQYNRVLKALAAMAEIEKKEKSFHLSLVLNLKEQHRNVKTS